MLLRFQIASPQLDPRVAASVADWIENPPATPKLSLMHRLELAHRVASRLTHPTVHVVADTIHVDDPDGFALTVDATGGAGVFDDVENERETLHELCAATGWVGFEPATGLLIVGCDLVCACKSAIPPHAAACGVCSAPVEHAERPAFATTTTTPTTTTTTPTVRKVPSIRRS